MQLRLINGFDFEMHLNLIKQFYYHLFNNSVYNFTFAGLRLESYALTFPVEEKKRYNPFMFVRPKR